MGSVDAMQPWSRRVGILAVLISSLSLGSGIRAGRLVTSLRLQGNTALQNGRLHDAESYFEQAGSLADQVGDHQQSVLMRANLASVKFMMFRYREALNTYREAAVLAHRYGLAAEESLIDGNLGSIYSQRGDLETAAQFLASAERIVKRFDPYHLRHQLLAERAYLKARRHDTRAAAADLLEAITEIPQSLKLAKVPKGAIINEMARDWSILGEELLLAGDLKSADFAINEAYRIRRIFSDRDLRLSYHHLAWLRLEQGKLQDAAKWMRMAETSQARDFGLPGWLPPYLEGRILRGEGSRQAAFEKFHTALINARAYLSETVMSGAPAQYAEARLKEVYADIIEASLAVDPKGIEGFLAAEEDRNTAFYDSTAAKVAFLQKAPPEFWSSIAELHAAEAAMLSQDTLATQRRVNRLKAEIEAVENRSGLPQLGTRGSISGENTPSPHTLRSIQESIAKDEALLSFHVARNSSVVWVLTRDHIEVHRLASEADLKGLVQAFRTAVENKSPDRDRLGYQLYNQLFGSLGADPLSKRFWTIAAEDSFFDIPLAALPVRQKNGQSGYLIEDRALLYSPAALTAERHAAPLTAGPFLGIGDGIYNLADPRRKKATRLSLALFRTGPTLELPRLVASDSELNACARAWDGAAAPVLLTGRNASTHSLETQLASHPAVIHIASHFVSPHPPDRDTLVYLGLTPQGVPDVLGEKEIATFRVPDAIVVMSGCGSGNNRALTMAGVLGLTRAWIIAGANAVVGSKWPVTDDIGDLFVPFYQNLRSGAGSAAAARATAESLRFAQIEMLHSHTWRSDPSYWGAFYVTGKD